MKIWWNLSQKLKNLNSFPYLNIELKLVFKNSNNIMDLINFSGKPYEGKLSRMVWRRVVREIWQDLAYFFLW